MKKKRSQLPIFPGETELGCPPNALAFQGPPTRLVFVSLVSEQQDTTHSWHLGTTETKKAELLTFGAKETLDSR